MSSENQELLARISQLAGHINRHKNQQAGISSVPSSHYNTSTPPSHASYGRGTYPSTRGRGSGYRVQKPGTYRNRTLVLNGSGPPSRSDRSERSDLAEAGDSSAAASDSGGSSAWVARTDRHRQLINADVYEKDAQARARAIEQTRVQSLQKRDARERAKLQSHLAYLSGSGGRPTAAGSGFNNTNNTTPNPYQIVIDGIPFAVAKNGSKLVKLVGDSHAASATPKTAIVGGVKFYRSKNGNLYRHGVVRAQRRLGGSTIKKTNEPCRAFSTTGSCSKGPNCRFIHDATKVAACKDFLLKGDCPNGSDCDLSHDLTPERTPFCVHYAKGNCTNPQCLYTHSQVSSGAPVCRPFGLYGYCDRGADCTERHIFECPDFSNTGVCKIKGCKLPHRERASFMRRANHNNNTAANGDPNSSEGDVSSDDDSVNSDDVDSDDFDEFVGADGDDADLDFVTQKDYIKI